MDATAPRIDLWIMRTDPIDASLHQRLLTRLDERERKTHQKLAKEQDRILYAAAHALKRHALSQAAPGDPLQWRFSENNYGKPALSNPPDGYDLRFNLSHTPGLVAIALSQGLELGLDVEHLNPTHADLDVAAAFAHPSELKALDPTHPDFVAAFYRLWTCKEALAKATGLGLALEVRQFNLAEEIDGVWHLEDWQEDQSHHIALIASLAQGQPSLIIHRIEPDIWD